MKKRLLMILMMFGLSLGLVLIGAQNARAQQDTDGDGVPDSRDNCKNTPNPEIIAFTFRDDILVWNSNNGEFAVNVGYHPSVDQDPNISADAKKVVFTSFRDGSLEIYVVNVDGSNLHRVSFNGLYPTEPAFSRDSSKIAFVGYSNFNFRIYVMNADGSGTVQVSDNVFVDAHSPAFSPDGSKVAFSAQGNIWVTNANGSGGTTQLTTAGGKYPSFSRDGSQIVFSSDRASPSYYEIYKMTSDGTGQTRLTNSQTNGRFHPAFSPNGSKIVYHHEPFGTASGEIWIMNSDGGSQTKIFSDSTGYAFAYPSWGGQLDSNNDGIGDACQDSTPPVITPNVTGTLGNNGWYRSNVQISWSVTDAESSVSSSSGCGAQTVSTDTGGVTFTCSATSVGGTGSQSVTIKRDATAPQITFASRTTPNAAGWNKINVAVGWNCSDALSGATSSSVTTIVSTEGSNQSASGICTDNAGNTAQNTQTGINIDKTAPQITFASRTAPNAAGWNNTNVVVNWNCSDAGSGAVSPSVNQTVSTEGGNQSATGTCVDLAGNSAQNTQTGINIDKTAPSISFASRTAANSNGWNNTNVVVNWSCSDSLSGVVNSSVSQTVGNEGANQSATGTCADNAGNTASNTQTGINIDKTAPSISFVSRTAPNAAGWNNTNVTVLWNCTDSLSGAASPTVAQTINTEGVNQSATGTCFDLAGNSASNTQGGIKIDKTAPTLAPTVTPNPVILNALATAAANATDGLSGIATESCPAVGTSLVGFKFVTCTATDNAGNVANANANYQVIYDYAGFFQPIDNLPLVNIVTAGQAVPVKFSLTGYQGLNIIAAGYPTSSPIPCEASEPGSTVDETVNAGGSSLSYDATTDRYSYVWKTNKAWKGTCRMFVLKLDDGTEHLAKFRFR